MADDLGIMLTELPEAESISDNDLFYLVSENNSEKVKAKTIKDSLLGDFYGEASGNPASFADGSASALVECETEIVPVQDLHGYDKPWAGGAGKNLFSGANTLVGLSDDNGLFTNTLTDTKPNLQLKVLFYNGATLVDSTPNLDVFSPVRISISRTINNTITTIRIKHNGNQRDLYFDFPFDKQGVYTISMNVTKYDPTTIGGVEFDNVMIESGSSMTTYEPYSNICPISGHSSVTINVSPTNDPSQGVDTTIQLGDTYYSGTLNVVTGELTVTHRVITENNFISVSSGTSGGGLHYANCDLSESEATSANAISNMLVQNQNGWGSTTPCFTTNTGSAPNIYPVRIYCSESTLADFKATYSGLQICYELATPITVQLTPTVINTLLGQNYISSEDTEDIDVVYTKSTAPIKPNPSGEADGYLSSIELSGEKFEIIKELPAFPSSNGNYKLKLSISNGVPTLSWVADT